MTTSHNCEIGFYVHFRCFCDGAVCVVCVRALLVMSKSLGSFVSPPAVQMKFQTFSACYRFSGLARIHGTFSRNCTAEFIWNKWNKGNFPVRLCLFYLGLFLFAFLFYKLFYYYQVFDCISASFVDVFSIRTFHITSHSSFHSLILRAPKAFSHRQRSTK